MMSDLFRRDDFFDIAKRVTEHANNPVNLVAVDPVKIDIPEFDFSVRCARSKLAEYTNNDTGDGPAFRSLLASIVSDGGAFGALDAKNITLAPSLTSASLNVIFALALLGETRVALASPCYYATRLQIERIGLEAKLIPTYEDDGFKLDPMRYAAKDRSLWVTQPIISLTKDFDFNQLEFWLNCQTDTGVKYLVIDEAVDCKLPAGFDADGLSASGVEVIRLRSLYKQVSINGQRLAFIVSSKKMARVLARETWLSHGGLDRFSLSTVEWTAKNPDDYNALTTTMLQRCNLEYVALRAFLRGTDLSLPPYENGYITSLRIDMREWSEFKNGGHDAARDHLVDAMANANILPTLAPSMYFAHEPGIERLRLGYLGATAIREKALGVLLDYLSERV